MRTTRPILRNIEMDHELWNDLIKYSKQQYGEHRKVSLFIRTVLKREIERLKDLERQEDA